MTPNPATDDERPVREQYADELRADPFYLPGVDDYDNGWVNDAGDEGESLKPAANRTAAASANVVPYASRAGIGWRCTDCCATWSGARAGHDHATAVNPPQTAT